MRKRMKAQELTRANQQSLSRIIRKDATVAFTI